MLPGERRKEKKELALSATYILEGFLVPESLVLLDLVLEELGYPEKKKKKGHRFRFRSGARQVSRRGK